MGKPAVGGIDVLVRQSGNEVQLDVRDDGAGLNLARIAERATAAGLLNADSRPTEAELASLIFAPGFTTAEEVTELAGRGVGMDVVRTEVTAMGGRIETASTSGQGTAFRMLLPLTTAVTQVVLMQAGQQTVAVPSTLVETVRRVPAAELEQAYAQACCGTARRTCPSSGWVPAAGCPAWHGGRSHPAGGGGAKRGPARGHPRQPDPGQPGSGGEEPGAAARACPVWPACRCGPAARRC
jgi:hypothetical protein